MGKIVIVILLIVTSIFWCRVRGTPEFLSPLVSKIADSWGLFGDWMFLPKTPALKAEKKYKKALKFVKKKQFQKAKEEFVKVLQIDPYYTSVDQLLLISDDAIAGTIKQETASHLFFGIFYLHEKKYDRAVDEFNEAIRLDPKYYISYYARGVIYYSQGLYARAISDYTRAIGINLKDARAYYNRGVSHYKNGDNAQAIADYTKAIEINPEYAKAYYNRGISYYETGETDRAIGDYTRAIEIDPEYAKAYNFRGIIYQSFMGNTVKGCADFKKACELGDCKYYDSEEVKAACLGI